MTYHIDYAYTCHAGKVRPNNEDNFWCCGEHLPVSNHGTEEIRTGIRLRESLPVMAVFDGMGGESQGEMAAWLASDSLEHFYRENKGMLRKAPELFLTEACKNMNQAVCDYGREQRISAMGTTMAMIAFGKKEAYICNLGDSRIYRFSKGNFSQISRDHVEKPSDILSLGQISEAKVVDFNGEDKKISLSMKALENSAPVEEEAPEE